MNWIIYVIAALAVWAHPTNSVDPGDYSRSIEVAYGQPNGGVADAYPVDGVCRIRVNESMWNNAPDDLRLFVMTHEIGHCLGLWQPATMHTGNGIMGCGYVVDAFETCQFTASDQFQIDSMHSSSIIRRGVIPMVAQ